MWLLSLYFVESMKNEVENVKKGLSPKTMVLKIGLDRLVRPPANHGFSPIRSIGSKIGWTGIRLIEPTV